MNIIDRLARWYAATTFGSSRLKPYSWERRRPVYDALSPVEQLEWRATALRWHLIGVGITVVFVFMPMAWFLTYMPVKIGMFVPLLVTMTGFAVVEGSWEVWKRRVWARRILERQPA